MASVWTPFLSAALGALAGFVSGLASEKFKGRLLAIRAEFARQDDLYDEAFAVIYDLSSSRPVAPSSLQKVDRLRSRLGENLRRIGYSSTGWQSLQVQLDAFQKSWAVVENAALEGADLPDNSADELHCALGDLRRAMDASSRQFPVYRFLGQR